MRTSSFLFILVTLLGLSPASGQESQPRIGMGVSLNPTALFSFGSSSTLFLPVGLTNIYVPIAAGPSFRVEPEAGIFSQSSETSSSGYSNKSSTSVFRIGVGFFLIHPSDNFNTYVGPRVGMLLSSSSSSSTGSTETKTSETDYFFGFCVGGEYMFSPHFSAGGEAQLNYVTFGTPDVTPATTSATQSRSLFTNNALMFFRWYF